MFNYNNISAGMSSYWLENDAAFYIKHNVGFDIYKATDKGSEKIASTNDPTVNIQVYGNDIYFVASETDVYVSFLEKQKIVHYSSDGISETVLS